MRPCKRLLAGLSRAALGARMAPEAQAHERNPGRGTHFRPRAPGVHPDLADSARLDDGRHHAHLRGSLGTAERIQPKGALQQHGPLDARGGGEEFALEKTIPVLDGDGRRSGIDAGQQRLV